MEHPQEFLRSLGVEVRGDGRRIWPKRAKAYIVAETLKPGATVKGVAHRFDVGASHVSDWRRLALDGKLVFPAPDDESQVEFAPVLLCDAAPAIDPPALLPVPETKKIEIVFRGVSIRLGADTAAPRIAEIARAVGVVE